MADLLIKSNRYSLTRLDHRRFFYHKCLVLDFLAASPPFAGYAMKGIVQSVTAQMTGGTYLVAISQNRICGYLGWLLTSEKIAEDWVNGSGVLVSVSDNPTAVAVTILAVSDPALLLPMIRDARGTIGDMPIFWKRHLKGRGLSPGKLRAP